MNSFLLAIAIALGALIALWIIYFLTHAAGAKQTDSDKRKEMRRIEIEYGQNDSDPFNRHRHD